MRNYPVFTRWAPLALLALTFAALAGRADDAPAEVPTLFIAGDSTSANGNPVAVGWGRMLGDYFDPAEIAVVNASRGGRSSRTFVTEGHWDKMLADVGAGDVVLIQFGHNDGGPINHERIARGSLPGLGDETEEIDNLQTGKPETVHTFGWYMRKMIGDVRAKEAQPILLSLTVRNYWDDGEVERGSGDYGTWIRELAEAEQVPFIDHTKLIADHYEKLGQETVNTFFPRDHVHNGEDGARLNAMLAVSGLKGLREQWIVNGLSLMGKVIPTADPINVYVPPQPPPKGGPREEFLAWLNLPAPASELLPTLWLIGDSTVRNGRGNGYDGQFGWGDPLAKYFYPSGINVVNRAVGGTGARTFNEHWAAVLPRIEEGDTVLIQFGHNDNGSRGALPGIGEETEERNNVITGEPETVHTFGWYLRRYIAEIRERGATPILCTLVPRNRWDGDHIVRSSQGHAAWTRAVAEAEGVPLIDLYERLARHYDVLGQEATTALFADRGTHTNWEGAELAAQTVVDGLRALESNPLAGVLRPGMGPAGHPLFTRAEPDGTPRVFGWRDDHFYLDDAPMLIAAGEMHFGRVLPEDWEHRIRQAKAMGLNTMSFYLFWNLCEPREGEFVFEGMSDVRRMLELCAENGMWAILRPGPYCCAEVEYGGIPWWTARYPEVPIRTNHPRYVEWSRRYIEKVYAEVEDLQVTRGGPLLMVQMENEYGMVARGNNDYLQTLHGIFVDAGFEVPLFTCDPYFAPERDFGINLPGVLRGRNGLDDAKDLEMTKGVIGSDPAFCSELYTAWFSGWGQPLATRHASIEHIVDKTGFLLENDVSFCYYVVHGGTTFGFFNGCNEFLPVQTSYDYNAPIDEAGRVTAKYHALRDVLAAGLQRQLPPVPEDPPVTTVAEFALEPLATVADVLPSTPTRVADHPATMEELGQDYGFVLYRKTFPDGLRGELELRDARDYTLVMVNGRTVAQAFVGLGLDSNRIALDEGGPVTLDLLVYNLGRISVITSQHTQERARKGLDGGAWLGGEEVLGWEMFSLPLANGVGAERVGDGAIRTDGPTIYRGTFTPEGPGGTFLDMRQWRFGVAWVNGHNLGRIWERGAQRSLFVPRHWLRADGENELIVLELDGVPARPVVSGGTEIITVEPEPFPVRLDRRLLEPPPAEATDM
ncbi:beta-galactosidase [Actomonas aquatica]|uniref:Beta-galactosidase n=1 Tax=Actomonas aquatica TaxID=2866162 RepID=A0ABZ1CB37_9BACT|nr:beta-galactosidase [Opitutus sp. WL0086]WRQ87804.1 beta-galactosidase [Opitutus sp. WL0086]